MVHASQKEKKIFNRIFSRYDVNENNSLLREYYFLEFHNFYNNLKIVYFIKAEIG